MLTVYADDPKYPMAMFVYDEITAAKENFRKTFLLQPMNENAPVIDGDTVIISNEGGKLILSSLTENAVIEGIGGVGRQQFINGMECRSIADKVEGRWGRVEISLPCDSKEGSFLNVLNVADADNNAVPDVVRIDGEGVCGAVSGNIAALFAVGRERIGDAVSFTSEGDGMAQYYVSGVCAGKWNVRVGGCDIGCFDVTDESGLLTFEAPFGDVSVSLCK